jgi:8-oxo-dGTP pyrophosphatase MutT (NUDIX family)
VGRRSTRQETSAGGVVVRRADHDLQYLLILDGHGSWGFPKGHLDPGESPLDAARREIAEETGVRDLAFRAELGAIDWYFRAAGVLVHKVCHFFLFETPTAAVQPQLDEGITECRWFSLAAALETATYDNARVVLRRAAGLAGVPEAGDLTTPRR